MADRQARGGWAAVEQWLLPPDVALTARVRVRWVLWATVAAGAIGGAAVVAALRAAAGRFPFPMAVLEGLRFGVPVTAALCTGAGVWWILRPGARDRPRRGVWTGVAVAGLSHPLAWGAAFLVADGANASPGTVVWASVLSLRAVGWVTMPLCAAGGFWVGKRFTGANCP